MSLIFLRMQKKIIIDPGEKIAELEALLKELKLKRVFYRILFRGRSMEFDGFRIYNPYSDDRSMVDWKASLRSKNLLVRKYVEEMERDIYFVVDVSNTMLFGSSDKLKSEYAAEFILTFSHFLLNTRNRIGLILFNENFVRFVQPSRGKDHFFVIEKSLSNPNLYGGSVDFQKVFEDIFKRIKNPLSVFIFLSDFIYLNKYSEQHLKMISSRFETLAVRIRDPLDDNLPKTKNQIIFQDPYSQKQVIVDPTLTAEAYKKISHSQEISVQNLFRKLNIDLLDLNTNESFIVPFISFLKIRSSNKTK